MTATVTALPSTLPAAEQSEDQRWTAWRARGVAEDARSTRRLRILMAVVIAVGIVVASVVLR